MRVADVGAGGRTEALREARQVERERVSRRVRQRDRRGVEARLPHVDRDAAALYAPGEHGAAEAIDDDAVAARLVEQQPRDAAGRIAAGFHLAAVGIDDAHGGGGVRCPRRGDHDELVEADAAVARGKARDPRRRQRERDGARVDHRKVVAEAVHLQECGHLALFGRGVVPIR